MPEHKSDKGLKGGSCNREDCQVAGAEWYNHSTEKYYCEWCAIRINEANSDAVEMYGHDLCTLERLHTDKVEGSLSRVGRLILEEVWKMEWSELKQSPDCSEPFLAIRCFAMEKLGMDSSRETKEYLDYAIQAIYDDKSSM